jgi:hypothetical protein
MFRFSFSAISVQMNEDKRRMGNDSLADIQSYGENAKNKGHFLLLPSWCRVQIQILCCCGSMFDLTDPMFDP